MVPAAQTGVTICPPAGMSDREDGNERSDLRFQTVADRGAGFRRVANRPPEAGTRIHERLGYLPAHCAGGVSCGGRSRVLSLYARRGYARRRALV